jgi:hypothetical protein
MFSEIVKIFTRPRTEFSKTYTGVDIVYLLWRLGYSLGEIRERISQASYLSLKEDSYDRLFMDHFLQFRLTFNKLKELPDPILGKDELYNRGLKELETALQDTGMSGKADEQCKALHKLISFDVLASSVHLKNVFEFGYHFVLLRKCFLYSANRGDIRQELDVFSHILDDIDKGDKKLNSPNLELLHENLKIIAININLIRRNAEKIYQLKENSYQEFVTKVGISMKVWEDILLDLRNPGELTGGRVLVLLTFYYFVVILLGALQQVIRYNAQELEGLLNKNAERIENLLTVLILPAVIWLFVYLYGYIKRIVTYLLLRRRFRKLLRA